MSYVLLILAFLAALVGVWGDTRDEEVRGVRGIRPLGWATIGISLVVLAISGVQTHEQNAERAKAKAEQRAREARAARDLRESTAGLFTGIDLYYRDCYGGLSLGELEELVRPEFLACLRNINTLQPTNDPKYVGEVRPMILVAEELTQRSMEVFSVRLSTYQNLLSPDLLVRADSLRKHRGFRVFGNAKMAIYADSATRLTRGVGYPAIALDSTMPFKEEIYRDLVRQAIALRDELGKFEVARTTPARK